MAEFVDVMKMARRMCVHVDDCNDCPIYDFLGEYCKLSRPLSSSDSDFVKYEADIVKWTSENPELRYPTWREWQQANFPNKSSTIRPCEFMRRSDAHCTDYMDRNSCDDCCNQRIPADIAEKLGIQPIAKENSG